MKKLLTLALLAAVSFTFAACAGECADRNKGETWCDGNTIKTCTGDEDPVEQDCGNFEQTLGGVTIKASGTCKTQTILTATTASCVFDLSSSDK